MDKRVDEVIKYLVDEFKNLDEVIAITLAGSCTAKRNDSLSDIDIDIFVKSDISLEQRKRIISPLASYSEIGNDFFGPGDEFILKENNIPIDIVYFSLDWIKDNLNTVLFNHSASTGYTTCFWNNISKGVIIYDPSGELQSLKDKCNIPYPTELKKNIFLKNYPILINNLSSYSNQIIKAIKRNDLISVNHRLSAFLASYFDIIFAINEIPHPGEKRLLDIISNQCTKVPKDFKNNITTLLIESNNSVDIVSKNIETLVNNLDILLHEENLL